MDLRLRIDASESHGSTGAGALVGMVFVIRALTEASDLI